MRLLTNLSIGLAVIAASIVFTMTAAQVLAQGETTSTQSNLYRQIRREVSRNGYAE